ncbi:MAG TPA: class I SAM-dependent methyltransferase [Gemmatimonadales bacterium]|nr:class I SAM-dependent methyltransferase [Gemmatimonadales bacterium]
MQAPQPDDSLAVEALRIQRVYAQRAQLRHHYEWSSPAHVFGHQERERNTLSLLTRYRALPLGEKAILEVGCGSGSWIHQLIRWGARPELVTGVDLLAERITRARQALPAAVHLECANAAQLPFANGAFDLVLQATMFTSVLDRELRRKIAGEMLRVLKSGGLIVWYDFSVNNPKNPDVSAVSKHEIKSLFPGCRVELRRVTLVPPVMRWLVQRSWLLAYTMSYLSPLCTHYLGGITKA